MKLSIGSILVFLTSSVLVSGFASDSPPEKVSLTFYLYKGVDQTMDPADYPDPIRAALIEIQQLFGFNGSSLQEIGVFATTTDHDQLKIQFSHKYLLRALMKFDGTTRSMTFLNMKLSKTRKGQETLFNTAGMVEDGGISIVGVSRLGGGDEILFLVVGMNIKKRE